MGFMTLRQIVEGLDGQWTELHVDHVHWSVLVPAVRNFGTVLPEVSGRLLYNDRPTAFSPFTFRTRDLRIRRSTVKTITMLNTAYITDRNKSLVTHAVTPTEVAAPLSPQTS